MDNFIGDVRKNYTITYYWLIIISSLLGFFWLLFEINGAVAVPWIDSSLISLVITKGIILSIALLLLTLLIAPIEFMMTVKKRSLLKLRKLIKGKYIVDFATEEDLQSVVDFGFSQIGEFHIDLEILQARFVKNQRVVTCIFEKSKGGDKGPLIGYYILHPLTEAAFGQINSLKIVNGRDLELKHIAADFTNASALYIGMAGGSGGHAAGYIVEEMLQQISAILHGEKLKAVFSRGSTADGKAILRKFGFQKLSEPSEISCLFVNEDVLKSNRIKKHLAYR